MTTPKHSPFGDVQPRGWIPWGVLAPFLALFFIILGIVSTSEVYLKPAGFLDARDEPTGTMGLFAMLLISFGAVGLLMTAWIKLVERRPLASVGLTPAGLRPFLGGHGIGILMVLATVILITAFGGYDARSLMPAFSSPTALFNIVLLLVGFALQSSVEEYVFRGWLLDVMARKFNIWVAVIVSSALFCLLHINPENPWHDNVNTFAFALFACAWVLQTGNIWGAMGWHAGWNWFMGVGFDLPITGLDTGVPALVMELVPNGPHWLNGGGTGPEGSVFCTLVFIVGTIYWMRRPKTISNS